jgi:signal transduction histidine kinase
MLYTGYFGNLLAKVFFVIIVLSIIFSLVYFNRIQKSFSRMISVLERFQNGDFEARFNVKENEELAPVTTAFNKMADLLEYNIGRLTKSEKERKDFIANISHDLRTPLSIARGYAETLLMQKEKQVTQQEQEEFLQLIHRKLRQVEYMVKQLFDLSKMESAEVVPNKEPFVPSEIVREIIHTYQLNAGEKKVSLKCTECQHHVWVNADIAMMERVFQNLIDNAIKNTPPNGAIQVSIVVKENDLVFTIENSGASIPADILTWINDSKDEGSFSGSRPAKVGLGLLIVKKILNLHQYFFKAESDAGIGNRFTIIMPVVQGAHSM